MFLSIPSFALFARNFSVLHFIRQRKSNSSAFRVPEISFIYYRPLKNFEDSTYRGTVWALEKQVIPLTTRTTRRIFRSASAHG